MTIPETGSDSLGLVSIILVTFNNAKDIRTCLDSVRAQTYIPVEIIVFDNASTDGTVDSIRSLYSEVKLVESEVNIGFAAANNRAAALAEGDFLAFLNPDTTVEPDWLQPLIEALESDPTVGAVTPGIVFANAPNTLNACGNEIHLSGIAYCREYGMPASRGSPVEVGAISGAAFVMRRTLFERVGGFEGSFFLYYEDTDLSLRLRSVGFRCLAAPQSRVQHAYQPGFESDKVFYLERNRMLCLLSLLSWQASLIMLPSWLLAEVLSWGYCAARGRQGLAAKIRAWRDIANRWAWIQDRRRRYVDGRHSAYMLRAFSPQLLVPYVAAGNAIMVRGLATAGWATAAPMLGLARVLGWYGLENGESAKAIRR
jgi:GT2 family glycosyltransferase